MDSLDGPAKDMIDATNRGDSNAVVAAFAPDAVLSDWGRVFSGHNEIKAWDQDENTGSHKRLEVTSIAHRGEAVKVGVVVSGGGFNGEGSLTFQIEDNLIKSLTIT